MKIGKVIGKVVSSIKDPGLDSLRLLIVQGLNDSLEPIGNPYVAADGILTAGPGDLVYLVSKKEAALVFSKELVPIDECIVGFVEEHFVIKQAKRKPRKRKAPPTLPTKDKPSTKARKAPKKEILPTPEPEVEQDSIDESEISIKEEPEAKIEVKKPGEQKIRKKVPKEAKPRKKSPTRRRTT